MTTKVDTGWFNYIVFLYKKCFAVYLFVFCLFCFIWAVVILDVQFIDNMKGKSTKKYWQTLNSANKELGGGGGGGWQVWL